MTARDLAAYYEMAAATTAAIGAMYDEGVTLEDAQMRGLPEQWNS